MSNQTYFFFNKDPTARHYKNEFKIKCGSFEPHFIKVVVQLLLFLKRMHKNWLKTTTWATTSM